MLPLYEDKSTTCGLAVDLNGGTAYWAGIGTINAIPLIGGAPTVLAMSKNPLSIDASDPTYVYWTDGPTNMDLGAVYWVIKGSPNTTQPIVTDQVSPCGIVSANGEVFWTDSGEPGYVMKSAAGTVTTEVSDQHGVCAITLDENRIYWVNQTAGEVMSALRTGGGLTTIANELKTPCSIAVDFDHVYWTDCDAGLVMSAQKPSP